LPRWEGPDDSSIPILVLPEDSQTIRYLLNTIYPTPSPTDFDSLETVARLIVKAKDYQMSGAEDYFRRHYESLATSASPFKLYFIARSFGLDQEAQIAARQTLSLPMTMESCLDDLQTATIADIRDLFTYRSQCYSIIRTKLDAYDMIPIFQSSWPANGVSGTNVCCERNGIFPTWFCNYMDSLIHNDPICIDLAKIQDPVNAHVPRLEKSSEPEKQQCWHCKSLPLHCLHRVRDLLHSLVEEAVDTMVCTQYGLLPTRA
jgi:hypothetical protein